MSDKPQKFTLKQEVLIIGIEAKGFVDKIEISIEGVLYRVIYWVNSERKETWMHESELKAV